MNRFKARYATEAEVASWDEYVVANPLGGNVLQSAPFMKVKARQGWKPVYLVFEGGGYASYNPVLEKTVPFFGKLWYLIKGPDVADAAHIPDILDAAAQLVRGNKLNVFAIKIEADIPDGEAIRALLVRAGLVKSFSIQANDSTAILDVAPEPDEILENLDRRGRNKTRRASRGAEECKFVPWTQPRRTSPRCTPW